MKNPFISVIIPTKKLSYYLIFENLPALDRQTYKNFEVIVLHTTQEQYDLTLLKKYKWLRLIPTGQISRPAEKRDRGVKEAKGDIIAFIDDDAYPSDSWLEEAARLFKTKKVEAIAGPGILPTHVNIWENIFDEVLKTFIGAGGYSYRFVAKKERYVDDYPSMNFLIKKSVFNKLGGFNSDYWPGEDSKLCNDLVYKEKGSIFYSPQVFIYHHRRNTLKGYLKQHANYGFHRGAFFAHGDTNSRRLSYLIPTFFVLYLIVLPFLLIFLPYIELKILAALPLFIYLWALLYLFLKSFINTFNIKVAAGSVIVLLLTHLDYGIQFIRGFRKGMTHKQHIYT